LIFQDTTWIALEGIARWREKLLSKVVRIILMTAYLASIPIYLLSFFKFSRWAIDLTNFHMASCFWDDFEGHSKLEGPEKAVRVE
jgi:hypothetical protein